MGILLDRQSPGVRWALILLCVWGGLSPQAVTPITSALQRTPMLNPSLTSFPDSSLLDHSARLDAPAGKHGFVTTKDGHFVFADGGRARFFGLNLAKESVFIERAQIDRLVALFARAGVNLVRIHHIDDVEGILDPRPDHYFRPERLDILDYWVAKLKERGIYLCLDLNDYRTFKASEGIDGGETLGRGAKPYAVFDLKLIELQQEYARKLLVEHVNPYTKLAYADDPAIALLEIYDENGLFIRRTDWPILREPYRTMFQQTWNTWLRSRYGTTALLRAAWTDRQNMCALQPTESLEMATVQLPRMDMSNALTLSPANPLLAPARVSDGVLFAYELQSDYLNGMREALRDMGVKIPITAVGAQDILPDLMATAAMTDYIGINFYWDHPCWNPGQDWKLPAYFSLRNPINEGLEYSFPVTTSLARMHGKPLVVREMGYCFPNPYRGVGMVESAAYGAMLDIDALILFTYGTNPATQSIGFFDLHMDPLRWGLVGQASRLFLSGEVKPAKHSIGIGYSLVDAFTWYQYLSPLHQLSFTTRVEHYTEMTTAHPYDLLIASGRSCGSYWLGNKLLLFANAQHTDLRYQGIADGMDELHGYHIGTGRGGTFDFTFQGIGFDAGVVRQGQAWPVYSADDLKAKGLTPVAVSGTAALGLVDATRKVIAFRNLRPDWAQRVALDALRDWNGALCSHDDWDKGVLPSDTGQLERDLRAGVLRVDTPTLQAIAGRTDNAGALQTSGLKLTTSTPVCTLTVESLDGRPLAESTSYFVAMTSGAHNDAMKLAPVPGGPKPHQLSALGRLPILTDGQSTLIPTHVELAGKLLLDLYLENGAWQYLAEPGRALLYVDTGNVTVQVPDRPKRIRWHTGGETIEITPDDTQFTIPAGVRFTEIIW